MWVGACLEVHVRARARAAPPGWGYHPPPSAIDDTAERPTSLCRFCAEISLVRHDADDLARLDRLAGGDGQLAHGACAVRMHLVLHLHRLDDADDLARFDLVALRHLDGEDRSLHRADDRVAPRSRRSPPALALATASPKLRE